MKNPIEELSDLEHQQWIEWSKDLSKELEIARNLIKQHKEGTLKNEKLQFEVVYNMLNTRLERWKKLWIPYEKLSEEIKEFDRDWAHRVLNLGIFQCPIYQCGGFMTIEERDAPEGIDADIDGYNGDCQSPDLVCDNCKARYQFVGLNKKANEKEEIYYAFKDNNKKFSFINDSELKVKVCFPGLKPKESEGKIVKVVIKEISEVKQ